MKKVKLSISHAKWYIKYGYESYALPSTGLPTPGYDTIMQMSLLVLMGQDIYGELGEQGAEPGTYRVTFDTPFGKHWAWYDFNMEMAV